MTTQPGDIPRCCWCRGSDVEPVSAFGPTLMTELYRCRHCHQDFEAVRWRRAQSEGGTTVIEPEPRRA